MATMTKAEIKDKAAADVVEARQAKARRFLRVTADCAAVEWAGVRYEFDECQRKVVERLWARREDDEPFEHERALLALSGSQCGSVRELFKRHPAWGVVIVWRADPALAGCYLLGPIPEDW